MSSSPGKQQTKTKDLARSANHSDQCVVLSWPHKWGAAFNTLEK